MTSPIPRGLDRRDHEGGVQYLKACFSVIRGCGLGWECWNESVGMRVLE